MVDYLKILQAAMPAPGGFEQCYAFSLHKAGSTLMHKRIGDDLRFRIRGLSSCRRGRFSIDKTAESPIREFRWFFCF